MKNLRVFLLGLALTPACLSVRPMDKQCFSISLNPDYPCCKEDNIVYTDSDGDWGLENGRWCGIGDGYSKESCFSVDLGYPCCKSCDVKYSDESGKWGIENKRWCGIKDTCNLVIEEPVQNATQVSNTEFDFAFLKMENNKKNMLYSPLSIEYALNMLQEGAANDTYDEINKIIGNSKLSKYSSIDKNLSLANGLIISKNYYDLVKKEYINALKEKYEAEIKEDEFKDAKNVNKWIEEKTLGIIKDMLKDETVQDPDLMMLIINALAIDMEWVEEFSCNSSRGGTFYLDDGKEIEATMMFQEEVRSEAISYYKSDDLTVLSMDLKEYNGTQFEFMALMPNKNLSGFVENVSKEQISEIDKNLKLSSDEKDGVNIRIPKFKFSYDLELKKDLNKLGIEYAFDKYDADFSKMVDLERLKKMDRNAFVSDALHKADIEFTEKGVKAAAVTVFVMMAATSVQIERHPISIEINKPFMFVIRDKNTKDVWFTGTVYEPNLWKNEKDSYKAKYNY